jgi:membrane associated rhomboid family serine protease
MTQQPPVEGALACYRHPGRETYVRCSRCERPICPDCMREAAVGHQCPECVTEGTKSVRQARTAFGGSLAGRQGRVTMVLIGLNVAVFVLTLVLYAGAAIGRGLFSGATPLHLWGAMLGLGQFPDGGVHGVAVGEYHRLVTSLFLHYGPLHLLLNMYALWMLGRYLEAELGSARFAGLYLLAGLGGSVAVYLFAPNSLSAGASGSIFGLFAALFLVLRRLGRDTSQVLVVLVVNLVLTFSIPQISVAGHLGGLVVGGLLGAAVAYAPRQRRGLVQGAAFGMVTLFLAAVTLTQSALLLG